MRKPCNYLYKLIHRGTEKKNKEETNVSPHASLLHIKGYVTFILNILQGTEKNNNKCKSLCLVTLYYISKRIPVNLSLITNTLGLVNCVIAYINSYTGDRKKTQV